MAAVLGLLAACGGGDRTARTPAGQGRVIDPGEGPRRVLRYELPEGRQQDRITFDFDVRVAPDAARVEAPRQGTARIELRLETSTRRVAGASRFDQRVRVEGAQLTEETDPVLFASFHGFEALQGTTYAARLESTGLYSERTLPIVSGLDPQRQAALDLLTETVFGAVPLPTEPVGAGARWEVHRASDAVGPSTPPDVTATYTLLSFDGEAVRLEVRIRPSGARTPAGALAASVRGNVRVDLHRTFASGRSERTLDAEVPLGARRVAVHQRVITRAEPR